MGGGAIVEAVIGRGIELPPGHLSAYPELARVRFRRGGLPVRVGGWCLGQRRVAAITLWNTIWLAPDTALSPELLLHESWHADQFQTHRAFPLFYVWESLRRGYFQNRYEIEARAYAAARMRAGDGSSVRG